MLKFSLITAAIAAIAAGTIAVPVERSFSRSDPPPHHPSRPGQYPQPYGPLLLLAEAAAHVEAGHEPEAHAAPQTNTPGHPEASGAKEAHETNPPKGRGRRKAPGKAPVNPQTNTPGHPEASRANEAHETNPLHGRYREEYNTLVGLWQSASAVHDQVIPAAAIAFDKSTGRDRQIWRKRKLSWIKAQRRAHDMPIWQHIMLDPARRLNNSKKGAERSKKLAEARLRKANDAIPNAGAGT